MVLFHFLTDFEDEDWLLCFRQNTTKQILYINPAKNQPVKAVAVLDSSLIQVKHPPISKGNFGIIYGGTYMNTKVAIKQFSSENVAQDELSILRYIRFILTFQKPPCSSQYCYYSRAS
jgi:hypothetical protein